MLYTRHQGGAALPKVECINPRAGKWLIRWDYQPHTNEEGEEDGITFIEHEFRHKPTLDEVKAVITEYINECIKKEITEGFVWNGIKVPLSMTDQTNYKRVLDLASQTKSANLPCDFWFGTSDEPVKQTFENVADLRQFWLAADAHINKCIAEGKEFKASFDWSPYEI